MEVQSWYLPEVTDKNHEHHQNSRCAGTALTLHQSSLFQHVDRISKLPAARIKEYGKTSEKTTGRKRPERASEWPNILAITWSFLSQIIRILSLKFTSRLTLRFIQWLSSDTDSVTSLQYCYKEVLSLQYIFLFLQFRNNEGSNLAVPSAHHTAHYTVREQAIPHVSLNYGLMYCNFRIVLFLLLFKLIKPISECNVCEWHWIKCSWMHSNKQNTSRKADVGSAG